MLELSEARFSARKFTDEPVSDADLHYILECARLAQGEQAHTRRPSTASRGSWLWCAAPRLASNCGAPTTASGSAQPRSTSFACATTKRAGHAATTTSRMATSMWPLPRSTCALPQPNGDWAPAGCATTTPPSCATCSRLPIMRPWPSFPWAMWPPTAHAQKRNANPWRRSLRSDKPSPLPANLSSQPQLSKLRQRVGLGHLGVASPEANAVAVGLVGAGTMATTLK